MKPKIKLRRRQVNKTTKLLSNLSPLLQRLYVSRGVSKIEELERSIRKIIPWQNLSGIEKAVSILYEAFCKKIRIVVVGDFDADGATSTALSILSFRALGHNNVTYIIPNRFENDYGLSPEIVDQAYKHGAEMIMTVDNGISSHTGVDRAHQLGILVLITDHHLPDNKIPTAEAIINPNLNDCDFALKSLAGVGVAFYLMLALRAFLYKKGWFKNHNLAIPNLTKYLDLVAIGTVADLVPLDANNRILIWQGLNRIRSGKCRFGITALLEIANCNQKKISTNDLSFVIGPRLNAAGRIDNMSISVTLLLFENFKEARTTASQLDALNKIRKKIEKEMQNEALKLCQVLEYEKKQLPVGLTIYHPNWHQGVIGILASRIKEYFHRPVIAFAKAGNGILKGSGRSIHDLHMLHVLKQIDKICPSLILKFGGHAMAVGISLEEKHLNEFNNHFSNILMKYLDPSKLQGEIVSDGPLSPNEMTIEVAQMLKEAGPWGQMFPEPLFDGHFILLKQKIINKRHLKVIVKSVDGGPKLNGIMFNVDTTFWPNNNIRKVELAYKLNINEFYGCCSLQIIIENIWLI